MGIHANHRWHAAPAGVNPLLAPILVGLLLVTVAVAGGGCGSSTTSQKSSSPAPGAATKAETAYLSAALQRSDLLDANLPRYSELGDSIQLAWNEDAPQETFDRLYGDFYPVVDTILSQTTAWPYPTAPSPRFAELHQEWTSALRELNEAMRVHLAPEGTIPDDLRALAMSADACSQHLNIAQAELERHRGELGSAEAAEAPLASPSPSADASEPAPTVLVPLTSDEQLVLTLIQSDFPKVKKAHERYMKAYKLEAIDVTNHYADVSHFNEGIVLANKTNRLYNKCWRAWSAIPLVEGHTALLEKHYGALFGAMHRLHERVLKTTDMKTGTAAATRAENDFAAMIERGNKKIDDLIAKVEVDLAEIEANYLVE